MGFTGGPIGPGGPCINVVEGVVTKGFVNGSAGTLKN